MVGCLGLRIRKRWLFQGIAQPQSLAKKSPRFCFFSLETLFESGKQTLKFCKCISELVVFNPMEKHRIYVDLQKLIFVQNLVVPRAVTGMFWVWLMLFCGPKVVFSFCCLPLVLLPCPSAKAEECLSQGNSCSSSSFLPYISVTPFSGFIPFIRWVIGCCWSPSPYCQVHLAHCLLSWGVSISI